MAKQQSSNRYSILIEKVFFDRYEEGSTDVPFLRDELVSAANELGIELPKNLGDVVYAMRYRTALPASVVATQSEGMEWIIEGRGIAQYAFKLVRINRIVPNPELTTIKIPDATPEIISKYALSDEQALLAKVRYNRLVDVFLGLSASSLQNHLRTTVTGTGQIEIDEVYVGIDRQGRHYILPMQAKGGSDQLSVVQTKQDIDCCAQKFPDLICRALSAQFMDDDLIAMFELELEDDMIKIVDERHYRLVPGDEITSEDLQKYGSRS